MEAARGVGTPACRVSSRSGSRSARTRVSGITNTSTYIRRKSEAAGNHSRSSLPQARVRRSCERVADAA